MRNKGGIPMFWGGGGDSHVLRRELEMKGCPVSRVGGRDPPYRGGLKKGGAPSDPGGGHGCRGAPQWRRADWGAPAQP